MNQESKNLMPASIILAGFLVVGALFIRINSAETEKSFLLNQSAITSISDKGVLPIVWGDLGKRLVSVGAIDEAKWKALYGGEAVMTAEEKRLLFADSREKLIITSENAGYLLNLFWALGLANKNAILETGEMTDRRYGGAQNFASTAGWTIASGDTMNHYSAHKFFNFTAEQQALIDKISRNIHRPCCNNSTHFPDCNHGMAMLGLLELMASQGVSESEMYRAALVVNSFWFPDNYKTIDLFLKSKGQDITKADPKEILGLNYSSVSGFTSIAQAVSSIKQSSGPSCDVEAPIPASQSGEGHKEVSCGI